MSLPDFSSVHPTIRPIDHGEGSRRVDRDPRPVDADLAERGRAERCRFAYDRLYPPTNTDPASCGRAPFRGRKPASWWSITAYDEYGRPQLGAGAARVIVRYASEDASGNLYDYETRA